MTPAENLNVALIQADLHWRSIDANLASFEEKIWSISDKQDLIVLPEMFTTGFTMEPEEVAEVPNSKTYRWLGQMAKQTKAVVMGSAIINVSGNYFNRMIIGHPDGSMQHYDKVHLFTLAGEDGSFSPGTDRTVFEVKGWKCLPQICYDLRFPVWSRSRSTEEQLYEYDVIIYSANWPTPRVQSWDALLKARAIENYVYSIGVNRVGQDGYGKDYNGHTATYDYLGNTLSFMKDTEQIGLVKLNRSELITYREQYPFQKDGDGFVLR